MSDSELQAWWFMVEQEMRQQAERFPKDSLQREDRGYLADGCKFIRQRDFPRTITKPEAQLLDAKLKEKSIPREWLFGHFKVARYGELKESQYDDVMARIQVYWNMYAKTISLPNDVFLAEEPKPFSLPSTGWRPT